MTITEELEETGVRRWSLVVWVRMGKDRLEDEKVRGEEGAEVAGGPSVNGVIG